MRRSLASSNAAPRRLGSTRRATAVTHSALAWPPVPPRRAPASASSWPRPAIAPPTWSAATSATATSGAKTPPRSLACSDLGIYGMRFIRLDGLIMAPALRGVRLTDLVMVSVTASDDGTAAQSTRANRIPWPRVPGKLRAPTAQGAKHRSAQRADGQQGLAQGGTLGADAPYQQSDRWTKKGATANDDAGCSRRHQVRVPL